MYYMYAGKYSRDPCRSLVEKREDSGKWGLWQVEGGMNVKDVEDSVSRRKDRRRGGGEGEEREERGE